MKKTRRFAENTAIMFLILAMLLPMFASCAENENPAETELPAAGETTGESTAAGEESQEDIWYETGLEKVNMDGTEFVFLSANWDQNGYQAYEIWAEEMTGDGLNDAIFERILYMKDTFNCSIRVEPSYNVSTANDAFTRSINAKDNAYNFFLERINQYQTLGAKGYLYDLAKIPHVDYEKIYWDTDSYNSMSIAGIHFAVCSDITILDKNNTSMMLFNKEMYESLQFEDPYKMVNDGKWTLDVLDQHTLLVSEDLDGNGRYTEKDRYGLAFERDTLVSFVNGAGYFVAEKDEQDIPVLTLGNEVVVDTSLRIMDILYDSQHAYNLHKLGIGAAGFFQNKQALYLWTRGGAVFSLRDMETDFGILPIPKRNEEQDGYHSDVNAWTGVCMVLPIYTSDELLDWTGIFMEEYACQGRNYVIPEYYDSLLTSKLVRDEKSSEMLDIIFNNRIYDPGCMGNWADIVWNFAYLTMTDDNNIVSFLKTGEKGVKRSIEKMTKAIIENYGEQ